MREKKVKEKKKERKIIGVGFYEEKKENWKSRLKQMNK